MQKTMSVATLNKLIPGVLPPVREPSIPVDFLSILNSFDPSPLTGEQLEQIAKSEPVLAGYMDNVRTYEIDGNAYQIPRMPAEMRLKDANRFLSLFRRRLGENKKYSQLRSILGRAIRMKVVVYIVSMQMEKMSECEMDEERENWIRYEEKYRQINGMGKTQNPK